jgi:hypothetical protein
MAVLGNADADERRLWGDTDEARLGKLLLVIAVVIVCCACPQPCMLRGMSPRGLDERAHPRWERVNLSRTMRPGRVSAQRSRHCGKGGQRYSH